jgi:hypothetical protein
LDLRVFGRYRKVGVAPGVVVIPAKAGIQGVNQKEWLDSRLRTVPGFPPARE